jgi:DNA (cytosine-5)-methyltransferase 1
VVECPVYTREQSQTVTWGEHVKSVELFAGAGGLALGTAMAGFKHEVVLERDNNACRTLRANQIRGVEHARDWRVVEGPVESYDFSRYAGDVDFVFGGPPCQPFSFGEVRRAMEGRLNE